MNAERLPILSMLLIVPIVYINRHNFDAPAPVILPIASPTLQLKKLPPKPIQYIAHPLRVNIRQISCLARNIYYEAGVEPVLGKYAVATVTLNRVKTRYWGDTICRVVYARAQFSWTKLRHLPKPDPTLWAECLKIADNSVKGARVVKVRNGMFYYADYIRRPNWAADKYRIAQIGQHIFYRNAKGFTAHEIVASAD
jgi:spore germination cell wall hydrolase CwlJ-like protein